MTLPEILDRWTARREELATLKASVDGATLCDQVLADLISITRDRETEALNLTDAARESGYSVGHLGREIRAGRIPNAGRDKAPKILRRNLPRKPGFLPESELESSVSRKRIARAVVNSSNEVDDG